MPKHILLVDDDPLIRTKVGTHLLEAGYEVVAVASGEAALEALAEHLPALVILDIGMPGIGGLGFLERITDRSGCTRVPVLVLTARATLAEYFADKPIAGFLTKPADATELLGEVQRILFEEGDLPRGNPQVVGDDAHRVVVLAEPNPTQANALRESLSKAGFSVEGVHTGAEAVEAVIARRPDGLILPMDSVGLTADIVLEILRKLPAGKTLPAIVYSAEQYPEKWVFIDPSKVTRLEGIDRAAIARAALLTIV